MKSIKEMRRARKSFKANQPMVSYRFLEEGSDFPLVIQPVLAEINLSDWTKSNQEELNRLLIQHGAILFRGFKMKGIHDFHEFIRQISEKLLDYKDYATPRSELKNQIYTSTDYAADHWIELHNEMAYSSQWPMKLFFYCDIAASSGGETSIADNRKVYKKLNPNIVEKFKKKKVMYVRNFGLPLGMKWQDVFQTTDKKVVEDICNRNAMNCIWKSDMHLRIEQIRPAVSFHPVTGEPIWFNQIPAFNITTLAKEIREEILQQFDEQDVPKNSFYGDGTAIEPEVLDHIRKVYEEETVLFPWQQGDILMLDNMLALHGRTPYTGERKILVGMAEANKWNS